MKKEEFMAMSLPYDIKFMVESVIITQTMCTSFGSNLFPFEDIKPILHPLSDLANEIEHNRDRFTPCDWIINKYPTLYLPLQVQRLIEDINWLDQCDFMFIKHLLEWHFDIAGLIEKGEAIDVNTLQTNPYK